MKTENEMIKDDIEGCIGCRWNTRELNICSIKAKIPKNKSYLILCPCKDCLIKSKCTKSCHEKFMLHLRALREDFNVCRF